MIPLYDFAGLLATMVGLGFLLALVWTLLANWGTIDV